MPETTPDTEFTLTHGAYELVVAPYGASLRGLTCHGKPVVTGYHGKDGKVAAQGDVLIPFPGRVTDGRYQFEGQTYQMPQNDHEASSAIHGFLRTQMWETAWVQSDAASFHTHLLPDQHPGYPFSLSVRITYRLSSEGLAVEFEVENAGSGNAPVAAGQHPYFTVGSAWIDADTLHLPFESYLEYKDLLPTGRVLPVEGSHFDFRHAHSIGSVQFNTCFLQPHRGSDGRISIHLAAKDGTALTVWLGAAFDYVVLYSGDPLPEDHRRRALAIEPMTCGSDAFNHPDWGLTVLAPGQTLVAKWGVTAE